MTSRERGSSIFEQKTIGLGLSLICLPILFTFFVFTLPFIFSLYLIAWIVYLAYAQTDAPFNLPILPSRVLKLDIAIFNHIVAMVQLIPHLITYLVWRYWKSGPSGGVEGITRDIPYINDNNKNHTYDLYLPISVEKRENDSLVPIVIFIYGGAWYSGSKKFYGLLANMLRRMGYIIVVPDYRRYPEVKSEGIYSDIRAILEAVSNRAESWGGDQEQIYILGHSAGAQIATQVVLSAVITEAKARANEIMIGNEMAATMANTIIANGGTPNGKINGIHPHGVGRGSSRIPRVEGLILLAGVFDIPNHYEFETARGVEKISAMGRVMGNTQESFEQNSPLRLLLDMPQSKKEAECGEKIAIDHEPSAAALSKALSEVFPRMMFIHGERDMTVPITSTTNFYEAVKASIWERDRNDMDVRVRLYKRVDHLEVITAIMPNIFGQTRFTSLLIHDIKDFIEPMIFDSEEDNY